MIQINLLPVRAKKRRETSRQFLSVYFLTCVLTVTAIGYLWISQSYELNGLNRKLAQVQQEVSRYAKYEQVLAEMTKRKEIIDKKRVVIRDLQKDRDTMVRILALLSVQVPPEKVWFERLAQVSNTLTLNGMALSNESIAEFMRNLESSPYVEKGSVSLAHSRQVVVNKMKLREFQVTCRFFPFSEVQKRLDAQPS